MTEETGQKNEFSLSKIGQGNELSLKICVVIEQNWISPTKTYLDRSRKRKSFRITPSIVQDECVGGCKSHFEDCLEQSIIHYIYQKIQFWMDGWMDGWM